LNPAFRYRGVDDDAGYRAAPGNQLVEQRLQVLYGRQDYLHHLAVHYRGADSYASPTAQENTVPHEPALAANKAFQEIRAKENPDQAK
jgi:hypothetical protein